MSDEEISPEEKLLKVIQGDGGMDEGPSPEEKLLESVKAVAPEQGTAGTESEPEAVTLTTIPVDAVPVTEPEPVVAEPVAAAKPARVAPKLKVAGVAAAPQAPVTRAPEPESAPESAASGASESSRTVTGSGGAEGSVGEVTMAPGGSSRRVEQMSHGLGIVNWGLAAAVFLIVCLTGWEIWGSVRNAGMIGGATGSPDGQGDLATPQGADGGQGAASGSGEPDGGTAELYVLEDVVALYEKRPIVMIVESKEVVKVGNGDEGSKPVEPPTQDEWEKYARQNLKLLGLSRVAEGQIEAIVSDESAPKMFYLQQGEEMQVQKVKVAVLRVGGDGVDLTDGRKTVRIK